MEREFALADTTLLEPPVPSFRLLHIARAASLDVVDKLAFDVFIELNGLVELTSPCLYFLAPDEHRTGFAEAEHAPATHSNKLMMVVVDQDKGYEGLAVFEERVRARARRLVTPIPGSPPSGALRADVEEASEGILEPGEPPLWTYQAIAEAYDPSSELSE